MIQTVPLQRVRIPVIALLAFALGALAAGSLAKLSAPVQQQPIVIQAPASLAQRPIVQSKVDTTACGSGAYVSGDMAGDASPAQVYAAMCGGR
jgi:hypothetical protein